MLPTTPLQDVLPSFHLILLLSLIVLACCISPAHAFGAGHLTEGAHLDSRAYRHGDISETLVDCAKVLAGSALALKLASNQGTETDQSRKSKKAKDAAKKPVQNIKKRIRLRRGRHGEPETSQVNFDNMDAARVYFGNYLRDVSQVLDIGLLKALGPGFLTNVVAALSFLAFKRGTREFEVTQERLGCYRQEEHIDNPWGYPDTEGSDPRELAEYQGLRPPVTKEECEVDPRTGMKNYIANEDGGWLTSSKFLRESVVKSIELGRSGLLRGDKHEDWWEALRMLGQSMHVMEDFTAHSNWMELCLRKLGHTEVFCYIGDNVRVQPPDKSRDPVPPLVTGTFGGADAMHSMMGEGIDKICEMGTSELSEALIESKKHHSPGPVKKMFASILKAGQDSDANGKEKKEEEEQQQQQKGDQGEEEEDTGTLIDKLSKMQTMSHSHGDNFHKFLQGVFQIHDQLARRLSGSTTLANDSGLLGTFVMATIEPALAPMLSTLSQALEDASKAVIEEADPTVLQDPNLENPSHSVLAKDHLTNLLNGPCGELAGILSRRCVERIVLAWNDLDSDPAAAADDIVKMLHHPYYADETSETHKEMLAFVKHWLSQLGEEHDEVLSRMTLEAVMEHRNNISGLKNASTLNKPEKKSKAVQKARRGLWGLIADGFRKLSCKSNAKNTHES